MITRNSKVRLAILLAGIAAAALVAAKLSSTHRVQAQTASDPAMENAQRMVTDGRRIFRFDTFGDEDFWGGTIGLHAAIQGTKFGGVGPGVSPRTALAVGLKVDMDALPAALVDQVKAGKVDLDDPAVTVALLRLNAVVGVTGIFRENGGMSSMGIQCALCHSTVDDAFAPGIGHRLDGWANRDLNVGAIVSLAPDLSAVAGLLGTGEQAVRNVLQSWGPGKFDASLLMDGKAFRPDGGSGSVLIPPAFGLAGVNLATWTGWGTVTYWNAFVANLEMHGKGRFFDLRLADPLEKRRTQLFDFRSSVGQFPVAARSGFADVSPDKDAVSAKLAALHFYQLSLPAPKLAADKVDQKAAQRGEALFAGKAQCNSCHVKPLFTEPGWNLHSPDEVCVDDFQANRSPTRGYRTAPLGGLFSHQKGGFYHDGRFSTLSDVIDHYNGCMNLGLTDQESSDLVKYLMTL